MGVKKKVGKFIVNLGESLGQGSFAKVFIGTNTETNEKVAVKVLEKDKIQQDEYTKKAFEQQIRIMMKLKSQNIIKFYDINQTKSNFYVVLQIANEGQFRNLLEQKGILSEKQAVGYLIQLLNGFGQMFKIGVIHRDIKPQNIFVKDGVLKIGDFGFAKNSDLDSLMSTIVGSPAYMAPQILLKHKYTYKCDIWSLGIMAYQMITGKLPFAFKANNFQSLYQTISNTQIKFDVNVQVSVHMKQFILGCLKIKQQERYDWIKVFLNPLFKGAFQKSFQGYKKGDQNLGYIMAELRMAINQNNINMTKQLKKLSKDVLNQSQFQGFIQYISAYIKNQDAQIMFNQIAQKGKVDINDFKKLLQKYGCRMKGEGSNYNESSGSNFLMRKKIKQVIDDNKISIHQIFLAHNNGSDQITFQTFLVIISDLVPILSKSDISEFYEHEFATAINQKLSFNKFYQTMCKICEQVAKNTKK